MRHGFARRLTMPLTLSDSDGDQQGIRGASEAVETFEACDIDGLGKLTPKISGQSV